jgi:hypothetical protein
LEERLVPPRQHHRHPLHVPPLPCLAAPKSGVKEDELATPCRA